METGLLGADWQSPSGGLIREIMNVCDISHPANVPVCVCVLGTSGAGCVGEVIVIIPVIAQSRL